MSEAVLVALITGSLTLFGTIVTVIYANKKTESNLATNQAVMSAELKALKEEVEKHNGFAQRMPVVEAQITNISHRVDKLEARNGT